MSNLDTDITVKVGLELIGGGVAVAAAFAAWIYAQFIRPVTDELRKRVRVVETSTATQAGKELPDRIAKLEERVPTIDKDVAVLLASEQTRNQQLQQTLQALGALIAQLKEDINQGDLDSRISSAQALVKSLQVALTLARIQGVEASERAQVELREAENQLHELLANRQKRQPLALKHE